jgi:rod shape-determining protein MreB
LRHFRSRFDVAIDLGTAATRVLVEPRSRPLSRPSTVWRTGAPRAALHGGVIVDTDAAAAVLGELMRSVPRSSWRRRRALACRPSDASPIERAAVVETVLRSGLGSVAVAPEPLAALVGAGIDAHASRAQAIVDFGEGVTDCAVVRDGILVATEARRVGVADLRAAVRDWIEAHVGVRVSVVEAERVLRDVGVGPLPGWSRKLRIVGSPAHGAGPVRAQFEVSELLVALDPLVDEIAACVGRFVGGLPTALADEVRAAGICLTGGGALLSGIADRLVGELEIGVWRAPDPIRAVVDGAHRILSGAVSVSIAP